MAHREEDTPQRDTPDGITVQLVDVEPFAGLCAAVARFCGALTPEVYKELSSDATEALSVIQGIMWRLEHANVERPSNGGT
jgi:hypothetical protein